MRPLPPYVCRESNPPRAPGSRQPRRPQRDGRAGSAWLQEQTRVPPAPLFSHRAPSHVRPASPSSSATTPLRTSRWRWWATPTPRTSRGAPAGRAPPRSQPQPRLGRTDALYPGCSRAGSRGSRACRAVLAMAGRGRACPLARSLAERYWGAWRPEGYVRLPRGGSLLKPGPAGGGGSGASSSSWAAAGLWGAGEPDPRPQVGRLGGRGARSCCARGGTHAWRPAPCPQRPESRPLHGPAARRCGAAAARRSCAARRAPARWPSWATTARRCRTAAWAWRWTCSATCSAVRRGEGGRGPVAVLCLLCVGARAGGGRLAAWRRWGSS